jgi:hypothetical protein
LLLFAHWKVTQDHQHQFAVALVSTIKQGTKSVIVSDAKSGFPIFLLFHCHCPSFCHAPQQG